MSYPLELCLLLSGSTLVWSIRGDVVECAASPLDPENRRAIWIQAGGNDWLVERGADKDELLIGRDYDHGGHAVGLVVRIHRISLRARAELALGVDGHQPDMIGAERVQYDQRAARGRIGQRFGRD